MATSPASKSEGSGSVTPGSFTCAQCDGTFEKAWSDEEAAAEAEENFGDLLGDPVVVCDDCYEAMTTVIPIKEFVAEQRKGTPIYDGPLDGPFAPPDDVVESW